MLEEQMQFRDFAGYIAVLERLALKIGKSESLPVQAERLLYICDYIGLRVHNR